MMISPGGKSIREWKEFTTILKGIRESDYQPLLTYS